MDKLQRYSVTLAWVVWIVLGTVVWEVLHG